MKNPHMLYQSPGRHVTDGISYEWVIVDEPDIADKVAEGWFRTLPEAHAAAQQALSKQIAANEAEQAAIAQQIQITKPARKAKP